MIDEKELFELRSDCPCGSVSYCPLEEPFLRIVASSKISTEDLERIVIQWKCVEKFKKEESERQRCDIGKTNAWILWAERGCAENFARNFSFYQRREISLEELYRRSTKIT